MCTYCQRCEENMVLEVFQPHLHVYHLLLLWWDFEWGCAITTPGTLILHFPNHWNSSPLIKTKQYKEFQLGDVAVSLSSNESPSLSLLRLTTHTYTLGKSPRLIIWPSIFLPLWKILSLSPRNFSPLPSTREWLSVWFWRRPRYPTTSYPLSTWEQRIIISFSVRGDAVWSSGT